MEEVEAARDDDQGAEPHGGRRYVAEYEIAEERHVHDLLVLERREDAGARIAMRRGEEVVSHRAEYAEQAGDGPLECAVGPLPARDRERSEHDGGPYRRQILDRLGRLIGG